MSRTYRFYAGVTLCLLAALVAQVRTAPSQAGGKVDLPLNLHEYVGDRATVVVFLSVSCPVANAYIPRLNELAQKYEPRGVKFVGVNANAQDSALAVARRAQEFAIQFPVLKDGAYRIADALRAERTPEVFLVDADRTVRYCGRIDDQIGIGVRRTQLTRADLAVAIDELLAGKSITQPRTEVAGCIIGRDTSEEVQEITYCDQVAHIIQKRCQSCHRPDGVAPFPLTTYEQARAWSKMMKETVVKRRMPPWHADPRYGRFANDRSLTEEEMNTLIAWVDGGAPKGDEKDSPPPVEFPNGWNIGEPDLIIAMPKEFVVPAEGVLDYQRFLIDPGFKEDVWVQRAEARPGSPAVHHILVYIHEPGKPLYDPSGETSVLCGYAPGDMPTVLPPGTAKRIPAGRKLLFEVHYTPTGKVERDRSSIALLFAQQPPRQEVKTNSLPKFNFRIPPHAPNHREEAAFTFPHAIRIISLMPHMHLRGKSWEYRVIYPDGRAETLLSVPRYDFNWQSVYRFADPPLIPRGAKLHCVAHWDNSKNNPANPDPNKTVTFGLQTWDEMMMGWMDYVIEEGK